MSEHTQEPDTANGTKIVKVSSVTNVKDLGESICKAYERTKATTINLRCMGASAVNQGIKGVIIANKNLIRLGVMATLVPFFEDQMEKDLDNPDKEKKVTLIVMRVSIKDITA